MNDLGYKPKKSDMPSPVAVEGEDGEPKIQHPTLRLNGEQAEKAKLNECAFGDEYEVLFRIKARRIGGESYEGSEEDKPAVEFDVISSGEPKMVEAGDEEEEKPKRKPKQRVVSPTAEDLAV